MPVGRFSPRRLPILSAVTVGYFAAAKFGFTLRNRCYELGCSVYMTKPVDPGVFVEAAKRLGLFMSVPT